MSQKRREKKILFFSFFFWWCFQRPEVVRSWSSPMVLLILILGPWLTSNQALLRLIFISFQVQPVMITMRVACLTAAICPSRTCLGTQHYQNTRTVNLPYLLLPIRLLCHTRRLSSSVNISPALVHTKCWFILSLLNCPICIWCVCVLSGCITVKIYTIIIV